MSSFPKSHEQFIEDVRSIVLKSVPKTVLEDRSILTELVTIHRAVGRILHRLQEQAAGKPTQKKPEPHLKVVRTPPAAVEAYPVDGPTVGELMVTAVSLRVQVLDVIVSSADYAHNNQLLAERLGRPIEQIRRATLALTKQGKITHNADRMFAPCRLT